MQDLAALSIEATPPPAAKPRPRVEQARRILAVDDDRMSLMLLSSDLADLGYDVATAGDGDEALERLRAASDDTDVIILDKVMPGLDGLEVVRRLKRDEQLRNIPVIMLTGDDDPDEIRQGVEVGVFHYLTKPVETDMLRSVLQSALRDREHRRAVLGELESHKSGVNLIQTCKFAMRTLDDVQDLVGLIAMCFPDPKRAAPGLYELLVNAVEHGNLEIGYEDKSELIRTGMLKAEIERRLEAPEYRDRVAEVVFTRRAGNVFVIVKDQGKGFNWRNYLVIDPARAGNSHGRGIAQAISISFDKVAYNRTGNQVVASVAELSSLDW